MWQLQWLVIVLLLLFGLIAGCERELRGFSQGLNQSGETSRGPFEVTRLANNPIFRPGMPGLAEGEGPRIPPSDYRGAPLGPVLRHAAVQLQGDQLKVFYSNIGDEPDHILISTIPLENDWRSWQSSNTMSIISTNHRTFKELCRESG